MIRAVCIYCASSMRIDPVFTEAAEQLGTFLGQRNLNIINGGGSIGLMRTVSDAVMNTGGTVTGVIPRFMVKNGWAYSKLTNLIEVATMHERKQKMAEISDAVIALPGGYGTMEELLEIITWKQLGLYQNPIVILNTNHYYDALLDMLHRAVEEHFIHHQHASLWKVADMPEEAIEMIFEQQTLAYISKIELNR